MFDVSWMEVEVYACGGVGAIVGGILGAVSGLFGGGRRESSAAPAVVQQPAVPAAPVAPPAPEKPVDTTAADVKARADEERKRRIAASKNSTAVNGGMGATGQAETSTPKLG